MARHGVKLASFVLMCLQLCWYDILTDGLIACIGYLALLYSKSKESYRVEAYWPVYAGSREATQRGYIRFLFHFIDIYHL